MMRSFALAFAIYGSLGMERKGEMDFLRTVSKMRADVAAVLLSVRDTYRYLEFAGKGESAKAVREIYGGTVLRMKKNDISNRVRSFAAENFLDDRSVYRRLSEAGRVYEAILRERMRRK